MTPTIEQLFFIIKAKDGFKKNSAPNTSRKKKDFLPHSLDQMFMEIIIQ